MAQGRAPSPILLVIHYKNTNNIKQLIVLQKNTSNEFHIFII